MHRPNPLRFFRRPARRAASPGIRRRDDRGASAVEFALLSVPLFTLVFGGIDYGLYFADVQTVQQATADAARDATLSVGSSGPHWSGSTACMGPLGGSDLAKVACGLSGTVRPIGGSAVYAKAEIVDAGGNATTLWAQGNRLRVCAIARHPAVLPFVPLPDGGVIEARVDMPIEPGGPVGLVLTAVEQSVAGVAGGWSWC